MRRRVMAATNRTLVYVGLAALAVIVGLQGVIFAIWGEGGDPPDVVVVFASVLFWGAVLVGLTVAALAVKRRFASRRT